MNINEKLNQAVEKVISNHSKPVESRATLREDILSNIQPLFDSLEKENKELREICKGLAECANVPELRAAMIRYQTLKQNGEKK